LKDIEATSFVRAEKIPQMKDGAELFSLLKKESSLANSKLITLVPNAIGLQTAIDIGVEDIAVLLQLRIPSILKY